MDSDPLPHLAGRPVASASGASSPSPSRQSSRHSINPATPGAISDYGDYFAPLSELPSVPSQYRRPSTGDVVERPNAGSRLPSIRIRRRASNTSVNSTRTSQFPAFDESFTVNDEEVQGVRPRSISQPERARVHDGGMLARHSQRVPQLAMPRLTEEGARPTLAELGAGRHSPPLSPTLSLPENTTTRTEQLAQTTAKTRMQRARNLSRLFWPGNRRQAAENRQAAPPQDIRNYEEEYTRELVDWLDIIDPEVQTLSTLTNVQNSLFIPDLGNWVNRRPTYVLSQHDPEQQWARTAAADEKRRSIAQETAEPEPDAPALQRSNTITSRLTDSHYAALPHGTSLEGWTAAEKMELDDHVRHMLHSRRARMKRRLKGFGQYVRRPLGLFVTVYATLITLFGLAWVLFLIGWIYVGEKQVYAIHVIDSVLVALFAIMGDGLAPFRAVDTYHMIFIAHYSRIINRAENGKPPRAKLQKRSVPPEVRESMERATSSEQQARESQSIPHDDPAPEALSPLESRNQLNDVDLESGKSDLDLSPLTPKQQKKFLHHQKKLAKSHSFYKPNETFTHFSFPLPYLIAIVILLDFHSCLQISLGACTWGIDYHHRPIAITTVILCVSITCNISAGLVISAGDRKTRKKDVMKLLDRQELTNDAIKHIEEKRRKEQEQDESSRSESRLVKEPSKDDSDAPKERNKLAKVPS